MLGTRTKQVFAYGKRQHRIVNVSEDRDKNDPFSILNTPTSVQRAPVVSKMRKRENAYVAVKTAKSPSPKVVKINRKKRPKPLGSPPFDFLTKAKKHLPLQKIIAEESPANRTPERLVSTPVCPIDHETPTRTPLSPFPLNVPGSITKTTKMKPFLERRIPISLKPNSPFVEMDIILLDQHGRKISQERRVSRTDIPVPQKTGSVRHHTKKNEKKNLRVGGQSDAFEASDSDDGFVAVAQPKPAKGSRKWVRNVVVTDESDSDTMVDILASTSPKSQPQMQRSRTQVEVVVPRALVNGVRCATSSSLDPDLETVTGTTSSLQVHVHSSIPRHPQTAEASTSQTFSSRYQDFVSSVQRPRQLTPIRRTSRSRPGHLFEPPSPPSPTTPSDFDLSFDVSDIPIGLLGISDPIRESANDHNHVESSPEYLIPLLNECGQETCGPHEFSAFIDMFPFDPIVRGVGVSRTVVKALQKIGEASFSEVFGIGDVVLKIVPLRDESPKDERKKLPTPTQALDRTRSDGRYGNVSWDDGKEASIKEGPPPSDANDVLKEIIVTTAMGEMFEGFVKLLRAYVVRGRYPEVLLKLWDEYFERRGSESIRPDTFSVSQLYAIIVLPNGGPDLESYCFTNANRHGWRQACNLFWQVARSLSQAEQLVSFEHRDLHWGQILVKDVPSEHLMPLKTKRLSQEPEAIAIDRPVYGVKATLIDLGLSRMDAGDGAGVKVHWTPFAEEIFMGEGDYQFDIYRMMRTHTQDAWEDFKPLTNAMWLHYLVLKLLRSKRLKPPSVPRRKTHSRSPAAFSTEKQCYDCLVEVEAMLNTAIQALVPSIATKGRGRRKTHMPVQPYLGPQSASDVIGYALKRGWLL